MSLIRQADFSGTSKDAELCRTLMREYAAHLNASVGGEHICVASLEKELADLPGPFASPAGAVLLAFAESDPSGCVAFRPLAPAPARDEDERACEMKRLWVRPAHHGRGLGRRLAEAAVELARERGYTAMYLDTMPQTMQAAFHIYMNMGFSPVGRYNRNPVLRQPDSSEIAYLRLEL